jgi:hypothetical protein
MTEQVSGDAHPEPGSHRPVILQDDRLEDRGPWVALFGALRPADHDRRPFATINRSSKAATQ